MKKTYITAECQILLLQSEDIMVISGGVYDDVAAQNNNTIWDWSGLTL